MPRAVPPRMCLRPGQVILVHSIARSQTKRSSTTRWLDQGDYEPVEPAIDPNEGPISIGERLARFSSQLSFSFLVGAESATLSGCLVSSCLHDNPAGLLFSVMIAALFESLHAFDLWLVLSCMLLPLGDKRPAAG
jgi:hypothetical protein